MFYFGRAMVCISLESFYDHKNVCFPIELDFLKREENKGAFEKNDFEKKKFQRVFACCK
jgi:hypothetical protein